MGLNIPSRSQSGYHLGRSSAEASIMVLTAVTTGTTAVNVLTGGNNTTSGTFTITAVQIGAMDTTAGNIIVKNGSSTVSTTAKGTTTGVVTQASSLANTAVAKGSTITVESSSAGNATVYISIAAS